MFDSGLLTHVTLTQFFYRFPLVAYWSFAGALLPAPDVIDEGPRVPGPPR